MNRKQYELSMAKGRTNNQASNLKSLLLSLLLIIGLSFSLSAQDKEVKKEISESYKVSKDFTLGIDNKYGNIEVVNWDKNELEVVVEMIAKATSEDKARKLLDKIDIEINERGAGVDFVTQIDFKGLTGKTSVEVNYKVNAPASINANIKQKYGSVFIEELTGDASITVKYSELKAKSLVNAANNANELSLAYSEATIKKAGILKAKAAYSELKLGTIEAYEGDIAYSEFTLMNLTGALMIDASYSEVLVENVEDGFEAVEISCSYGDVEVVMNENVSYKYDLETKYGDIDAPKGAEVTVNDHGKYRLAKGSVGSSASGEVKVSARYTDLKVR